MFKNYDPREGKMLSLLNADGILKPNGGPVLSDEGLLEAYRGMLRARVCDDMAVSYQRQGRMLTYPPLKGQEANQIGMIMAINKNDWLVPGYREMGAWLQKGVPLYYIFLAWYGNELGNSAGKEYRILPIAVPIASQTLHAVGIGYAMKYKKEDAVVVACTGDGGTSQGDFSEAMNFAGVWKVPVIFYIQNNQYAISCPRSKQTAVNTLAERAFGFGFEGVQIDGNDIQAVYQAVKLAADKARNGGGPTLIEGYTYRLAAHTTSDDPTRYRKNEEVAAWEQKDPLLRLKKYLLNKKMITAEETQQWSEVVRKEVDEAFRKVEASPDPTLEDIFKYHYKEMPAELRRQLEQHKAYLERKAQQ
jgi:pyruvate dehydrogenase E1 component alpha subunit